MYNNENMTKLAKTLIFAVLCSSLQSSFTQENTQQNPVKRYYNPSQAHASVKYHASIRLSALDHAFGEGHICSGAIVAPSVVLTSASCLYNFEQNEARHAAELKIVMGNANRFERTLQTLIYEATHIYLAPNFDALNLNNNIAIIMLSQDIPARHASVKAIKFAAQPLRQDAAQQAGYGLSSWAQTEMSIPSTHLQALNATNLGDNACSNIYRLLYKNEQMHCIALQNMQHSDICPSDVGAPLIKNNKLVGLASFEMSCNSQAYPAVFTDVGYHAAWIRQQIGSGNNQNGAMWGTLAFVLFTAFTLKRSSFVKQHLRNWQAI